MFQLFQSLQVWPSLARTQTRSVPVEALPMNCVFARSAAETGIVTFTPASMPFTAKWPLPAVLSQNSYFAMGSLSASVALKSALAATD